MNPDPAGLPSDVAPDWVSVAAEWDGVHVGFGGLLAAGLRPLGPVGERTTLWSWECEQTVWVRDALTDRAALPALTGPPSLAHEVPPLELAAARTGPVAVASVRSEPTHRRPRRRWFRR